jgi:quinol monooxygenase YgiN
VGAAVPAGARYSGARLMRDEGAERVYVTMDEWESRAAYEEFREEFAAEYEELDRRWEGMTAGEKDLASAWSAYCAISGS